MLRAIFVTLAVVLLSVAFGAEQAKAASLERYEVYGVETDDMLKLRAGPGTGYSVIVGLPNGTVLRVHNCERIGSTRWCRVSLEQARRLKGYVSGSYLRKM